MDRAVEVTGVGVLSALGSGAEHFNQLVAGRSAIRRVAAAEYQGFPALFEAAIAPPDRRAEIETRMLRKLLSDASWFGLLAAGAALKDAGLRGDAPRLREAGLYVGSICLEARPEMLAGAIFESLGSDGNFDPVLFGQHGISLLDPLFLVRSLPNAGTGGIAIEYQVLGPNLNLTNGPVSGMQSIQAAAAAIARGEIDVALAGAYDSMRQVDSIVEQYLAGRLCNEAVDPDEACRPFSRHSAGYAAGEGAAFVVLEAADSARARGARPLARVLGYSDRVSFGDLSPANSEGASPSGLLGAAREALELSGWPPRDVDVVVGDALALAADDTREATVYGTLFGEHAVPYWGATPAIGFTGAALSAFNVAHAVLALREGVVPPTLNCSSPAPGAPQTRKDADRRRLRNALAWCSDQGFKSTALFLGAPPS